MRSFAQILTTPTADTPSTTLLLHFDDKRYLLGNLGEGTQRACVQLGTRLLKVSEAFITGRTEWRNIGGLIGMILTLADSSASSQAAVVEEARKKALAKGKRLGVADDVEKMSELLDQAKVNLGDNTLTLFGPRNLNHTLATARRYVFRKGMPLDVHEIPSSRATAKEDEDEWAPYWADKNIKVWAMSIAPSTMQGRSTDDTKTRPGNPRKRSIEEVYAQENAANGGTSLPSADGLSNEERDYLTVKAVVSEMFNSSWRLDTLHETTLADVKLPATIFVRDSTTNKLGKYTGPLPGGDTIVPNPDMKVLVRKPWPGALVESLPPTQPAKEAISYIIRNHMRRGKFKPDEAKRLKVKPGPLWSELAAGGSVLNEDGESVTPEMVLEPNREGAGMVVADLPGAEYLENLLCRPEWREPKVMAGVGAVVWICGKGVASDYRLHSFMKEFGHLEHVVSSPDYCPNPITMESATASTLRLRQVDPHRYGVPVHDNVIPEQSHGGEDGSMLHRESHPLPDGVHIAAPRQVVQLEPSLEFQAEQVTPSLNVPQIEATMSQDVLEEAHKAQAAIMEPDEQMSRWVQSLPPDAADAEIITLGTGSALPSKYRNVSATLVKVPGWGNLLLDCGENTLGQLKRVFNKDELRQVLLDLKLIFISHMHADHHLGTTAVIKAWYEEVHGGQPASSQPQLNTGTPLLFEHGHPRLALIAEPAMSACLAEYSAVEDFGYSHLVPLVISPADLYRSQPSLLNWFIPPSEINSLPPDARAERAQQTLVPGSRLNLQDVQAVAVHHCHGARAVSITFPSGFKVSYSGDCRPSRAFARIGRGTTVCVHEATFDDELHSDAEAKNHCTTSEALGVAQGMQARACVLTHFSQRYQKVPVLERATEDGDDAERAAALTEEDDDVPESEDVVGGPLETPAATFPDQDTTDGAGQLYELPSSSKAGAGETRSASAAAEAVRVKVASDMKVCVAFDYMRVKVGDIGHLEKFTPALLKLFADEEKEREKPSAENGIGPEVGKKKADKRKVDKKKS